MPRKHYMILGCLGLQFLAGGIALAEDPPREDTLAKLNAMQAQMQAQQQQLQAQQSQISQLQSQLKQTQETTHAEVQEQIDTVRKLYEQASGPGKFLSMPGVNGGFDVNHGFFLQSDDGQSVWHPYALLQGRDSYASRSKFPADGMVEIGMDGSLFSKDLTYNFTVNYGTNGVNLQYAWARYVVSHQFCGDYDLAVRAGLYKNPAFKETGINDDPNQLMVQTSLANTMVGGVASGPLVRALDFILRDGDSPFHAEFGLDSGPSPSQYLNAGLIEPVTTGEFGFFTRVDYKPFGQWIDTHDLTGKNHGESNLLDIGGGIDIVDTGATGIYRGTLDVQYLMASQWTAFAALYGDHHDLGGHNDWGFVMQGGYFVSPHTQLTARYSFTRADPAFAVATEDTYHELAVGCNYFLGKDGSWANHAKLSIDLTYLPSGSPMDGDLAYYTQANKREFVIRSQFQIWL